MLMHVKYVAFMIPVYLLLIFFVSMQDECEQMGAYLTEVETVDENTWLTTTFYQPNCQYRYCIFHKYYLQKGQLL